MKQAKAEEVGDRAAGCTLCIVVDLSGRDVAGYLGERAMELARKHAYHLNVVANNRLVEEINKHRKEIGRARLPKSNIGRTWRLA